MQTSIRRWLAGLPSWCPYPVRAGGGEAGTLPAAGIGGTCEADFRPNATIYKVRQAKSLYPFATLPYDPYKSAIALFLSEFLYRAVREEAENRPLFAYLYHCHWLDECREGFANFHLVFLMCLSRFLGLYPNLEDYHAGDYFDLQNACFTPLRPVSIPITSLPRRRPA